MNRPGSLVDLLNAEMGRILAEANARMSNAPLFPSLLPKPEVVRKGKKVEIEGQLSLL